MYIFSIGLTVTTHACGDCGPVIIVIVQHIYPEPVAYAIAVGSNPAHTGFSSNRMFATWLWKGDGIFMDVHAQVLSLRDFRDVKYQIHNWLVHECATQSQLCVTGLFMRPETLSMQYRGSLFFQLPVRSARVVWQCMTHSKISIYILRTFIPFISMNQPHGHPKVEQHVPSANTDHSLAFTSFEMSHWQEKQPFWS